MGNYFAEILVPVDAKLHPVMCRTNNPMHIQRQYYETGDLVIGAITSQIFSFSYSPVLFKENPQAVPIDEHGYGSHFTVLEIAMSEKIHLSSLYLMLPNEAHQYTGIVQLLLHFQWTWVGLIVVGDDQGEKFAQTLTHLFSQNGICPAFTQNLNTLSDFLDTFLLMQFYLDTSKFLTHTDVNVFVINSETGTMITMQWVLVAAELYTMPSICKVWVMTAHWDFSSMTFHRSLGVQVFHGALSFAIHANELQGFQSFLQTLRPYSDKDGFIRVFWEQAFDCFFPDTDRSEETMKSCTGEEKLESLPGPFFEMSMTGHSYSIYKAVYAVAHAFHAMHSSRSKCMGMVGGNI
ncbi:UNVERIFIED_CONTAM: hypothetical protein K2H54_033587 [Gekko kuhli]